MNFFCSSMDRRKMGLAVIINNLDRQQPPTMKDVVAMESVLKTIGENFHTCISLNKFLLYKVLKFKFIKTWPARRWTLSRGISLTRTFTASVIAFCSWLSGISFVSVSAKNNQSLKSWTLMMKISHSFIIRRRKKWSLLIGYSQFLYLGLHRIF